MTTSTSSTQKTLFVSEMPCCPVCQEEYDTGAYEPKVLTCGHSICTSCLPHIMDAPEGGVPLCPTCRARISSSITIPKNFQLNDSIQSIKKLEEEIERLKASMNKKPENGVTCSNCKDCVSEHRMHICCDCVKEVYGIDLSGANFTPDINVKDVAICSNCAILNHVQNKHHTTPFFPILAGVQFANHLTIITGTRNIFDRDVNNMNMSFKQFQSNVEKWNKSSDYMTTMVRRSKSSTYQDDIMAHFHTDNEKVTNVISEVEELLIEKTKALEALLVESAESIAAEAKQKCDEMNDDLLDDGLKEGSSSA